MSTKTKRMNIADEKFSKKNAVGFAFVRLGNILAGLMIGEDYLFCHQQSGTAAAAISVSVAIKTAIDAVTDLIMGPSWIRPTPGLERRDPGCWRAFPCG